MSDQGWEEVEAPIGNFVGWGNTPGNELTGKVIFYTHDGGVDFNGVSCPQITVELMAPMTSYKDKGMTPVHYDQGQVVMINAGQANLKANVIAAQLLPGNLVNIKYISDQALPGGKSVKQFKIRVNRNSQDQQQRRPQPAPPQAPPPYQGVPTPPQQYAQPPAWNPQSSTPQGEEPPF